MKRYALRQVGTNKYLENHSSSGIGVTHHEFRETKKVGFYTSAGRALQSLSWWRDGIFSERADEYGDPVLRVKVQPHRLEIDVEIVTFELQETAATLVETKK